MGTAGFNFYSAAAAGASLAANRTMTSSPVKGAGQVSAPSTTGALSLTQTLQQALHATLNNALTWTHQQLNTADQKVRDVFTAHTAEYDIEISGYRPPIQRDKIPDELKNWMVTVNWKRQQAEQDKKEKPVRKVIDGNVIVLPQAITTNTDPKENTIGKLFRVVYEKIAGAFSQFVPLIKQLTDKLRKKDVTYSYSRVQPDIRFGLQGAKVLQVGETEPKIVVSNYGISGIQVTVVQEKKSVRLGAQHLQNPALKGAINDLIKEVNRQRLNNPNSEMGLADF